MLSISRKLANRVLWRTPTDKIHPETTSSESMDESATTIDPCIQIYEKHKEPGAYDRYKAHLKITVKPTEHANR